MTSTNSYNKLELWVNGDVLTRLASLDSGELLHVHVDWLQDATLVRVTPTIVEESMNLYIHAINLIREQWDSIIPSLTIYLNDVHELTPRYSGFEKLLEHLSETPPALYIASRKRAMLASVQEEHSYPINLGERFSCVDGGIVIGRHREVRFACHSQLPSSLLRYIELDFYPHSLVPSYVQENDSALWDHLSETL